MDRTPTPPGRRDVRAAMARRLRLVRLELYGEQGGPLLAEALRLPSGTWANFERGVTIPGEVLLEFLELTGCEPLWLLRGAGGRYRTAAF